MECTLATDNPRPVNISLFKVLQDSLKQFVVLTQLLSTLVLRKPGVVREIGTRKP